MGQGRRLFRAARLLQLLFLCGGRRRHQRAGQIPAARARTDRLAGRRQRTAPEFGRSPQLLRLPRPFGHRRQNRLQLFLHQRQNHHLQRVQPHRQTHLARLLRLRFAQHRLRHARHRLPETRLRIQPRPAQRTRAAALPQGNPARNRNG